MGSFTLAKGVNKFCLAQPGLYKLIPESCHQFEQDIYRYDTATPAMLTLTAVKHRVQGKVTTSENINDISISMK